MTGHEGCTQPIERVHIGQISREFGQAYLVNWKIGLVLSSREERTMTNRNMTRRDAALLAGGGLIGTMLSPGLSFARPFGSSSLTGATPLVSSAQNGVVDIKKVEPAISRNPTRNTNARSQPNRPTDPTNIPPATLKGKVIFEMIAHKKRLSFTMIDVDQKGLVGKLKGQNHHLVVPHNTIVEIELILSDSWDWNFVPSTNDFTLATDGHEVRYWIQSDGSSKSRLITIEPTGRTPEPGNGTGRDDEKFNLGIELSQDGSDIKVGVEIDPITKNPPPGGG